MLMADSGTIEIKGLDERIKQLGEASTKNPMMRKRINEVIRTALMEVRKKLQNEAKSGLDMQSDPRKAYKAVRMAVYRRIFGGQVNILQSRKAGAGHFYTPPRKGTSDPKGRGGNRRPRSQRTIDLMTYQGVDRGFILRFLNQGTTTRNITHLTEVKRADGTSKFRFTSNGCKYGNRGSIAARNWFGNASLRELERQASNLDAMIDNILEGILY
jgi:hypothetical protein